MLMFLYDLPNWLLGLVVVGASVLAGYAIYFSVRKIFGGDFTEDQRGVAMTIIGIIATINSLLLAFSAVSVWESFSSADAAVVAEANTIGELARDLAIFDSEESKKAREMLRDYARAVVNVEWKEMEEGKASTDVWDKFDRMFDAVGLIHPDTPRRVSLLPEILTRANETLKERRSRLYSSQSEVPGTLWSVVLLGTVLTMGLTVVLTPTRFHLAMIGALSFSIGLVFYFLMAMDRPFAGKESISPAPFESAIANMQRWDETIAKPTVE